MKDEKTNYQIGVGKVLSPEETKEFREKISEMRVKDKTRYGNPKKA